MPPEEQAPSPSMSESLATAIESVESTPAPETPAPAAAPEPSAAPPSEPQPTAAPARTRNPDGTFTRRDPSSNPAPAPAPSAAPAVPGATAPTPAAPVVPTADTAPASWTPAAKEKWTGLDAAIKSEVARREREIEVGMSKASEVRRFGDSVMQEFAPYAKILEGEGATPQAAIRALLETTYTLRFGSPEHKQALFMSLAQQYGIDLTKQIDPEKARLQWELDSRQVNDARYAAAQQQHLQQDVQGELEQFINSPGHEHYPTVRLAMAGLIRTGVAANLQDAYERACWADPTARQAMQLAENARRVADQAKNRNALGAVNGAPGAVGMAPNADPGNLRSFLEQQFAATAGRY